ncbi:hypothetical protein GCM10020331_000920 [Ectobacillus funiculus]
MKRALESGKAYQVEILKRDGQYHVRITVSEEKANCARKDTWLSCGRYKYKWIGFMFHEYKKAFLSNSHGLEKADCNITQPISGKISFGNLPIKWYGHV